MIEVVIDSIRMSQKSDFRIVILREKSGERFLPLWVGVCEADILLEKLNLQLHPQPPTFDYFHKLLLHSDLKMKYALIHSVVDDVYYARFVATRRKFLSGETVELDCRPSDAIAMALYCRVPIFASDELMAVHSIRAEQVRTSQPSTTESADAYTDFWQNFIDCD